MALRSLVWSDDDSESRPTLNCLPGRPVDAVAAEADVPMRHPGVLNLAGVKAADVLGIQRTVIGSGIKSPAAVPFHVVSEVGCCVEELVEYTTDARVSPMMVVALMMLAAVLTGVGRVTV